MGYVVSTSVTNLPEISASIIAIVTDTYELPFAATVTELRERYTTWQIGVRDTELWLASWKSYCSTGETTESPIQLVRQFIIPRIKQKMKSAKIEIEKLDFVELETKLLIILDHVLNKD